MKLNNKVVLTFFIIIAFITSLLVFNECGKKEEGKVKLGVIIPLTGAASQPGTSLLNGLKLGLKNHSEYTLLVEDSKSDPKVGVLAYRKLVNINKCDIIIVTLSSISLAIIELAKADKIPIIISLSNYPNITRFYENSMRFFINSSDEGELIGEYLLSMNYKKIGIVYMNDEGSLGSSEALMKRIVNDRNTIVFKEEIDKNKQDFKDEVAKIRQYGTDAISIIGSGKGLGTLAFQLRKYNITVPIISTTPMGASDAQSTVGPAIEKDIFYLSPYFPFNNDSLSSYFRNEYFSLYGSKPDFLSAFGFDLGTFIKNKISYKNKDTFIKDIVNYRAKGLNGILSGSLDREIKSNLVVVKKNNSQILIVYKRK